MVRALRVRATAMLIACIGFSPWLSAAEADSERYRELIKEIRCLVCQNQSIADSQADLATDLKREVREMIDAGKTDEEILDFLTERYGDFVLYRPPVKENTLLLWLGPGLLVLIGAAVFLKVLKSRAAMPAGDIPDSDRAGDDGAQG